MKKVLSVFLSIVLMLSAVFSGAVVNAASSDVQVLLESNSQSVNVGSVATVNVTTSGTAFSVAVLDFTFDTSALRLTGVTSDVGFECAFFQSNTGARVLLTASDNKTGSVATLTFETLKSGTEPFTISLNDLNSSFSDSSANTLVGSSATTTITINCDHQYVFSHVKDPTCSEEGKYVYICSICGEEDPDSTTIEKIDHIEGEVRVTKEPDCVNTGFKQTHCAICDEPIGDPIVIPANGHTFGEWMIDEFPTCSKDGVRVHICEICGDEVSENIDKSEHNSSLDNATWVVVTPASCGSAGTEALICNDCGEIKDEREIPAVDHDYILVVTKATCKEAGEEKEVCRICGDIKQSTPIQKLPHTEGETVVVEPPTCDSAGSEETYCAVCGEVVSTRVLEKLDHIYGSLNVITSPTNTSTGTATHTCTLCDHTENVTLDITNAYLGAENLLIGKIEAAKTIKLAISIENSKLFYAGMFEVNYNSEEFEYVGYEANGIDVTVNDATEGKIIVIITADSVLEDGKIMDLLFNSKTKKGGTDITITNAKFSDGESDVFFNLQDGSLNIESVIDGDVNGDGLVDIVDFSLLKKYVAGMTAIQNKDEADVNYDGKVNITDLAILKKVVSGIITLN